MDGDELGERQAAGRLAGRLCSDQDERCSHPEGGTVHGKRSGCLKRAVGNRGDRAAEGADD